MENTDFFLLGSVILSLIIGFGITWKIRGPIQAMVVRSIPPKQRFSEQSVNLRGKYSTLLMFVIGFGLTALILYGIQSLGIVWGKPLWNISEQTIISKPNPPKISKPKSSTTSKPDTFYVEPVKQYEHSDLNVQSTKNADELEALYFLQLYAFKKEARAWRQKSIWEVKVHKKVKVGIVIGQEAPYKVLIGPFKERKAVLNYKNRNQLKGFPREATDIRLYEP